MSAPRRALTISLPASDPRSAVILDWLHRQPPQSDVSAELRGLLVQALGSQERLARIEAKLDKLLTTGVRMAESASVDVLSADEMTAAISAMLDFNAADA